MPDREQRHADSLADFVGFAIDTNNSVIEDDGYYFVQYGMPYTFTPTGIDVMLRYPHRGDTDWCKQRESDQRGTYRLIIT